MISPWGGGLGDGKGEGLTFSCPAVSPHKGEKRWRSCEMLCVVFSKYDGIMLGKIADSFLNDQLRLLFVTY